MTSLRRIACVAGGLLSGIVVLPAGCNVQPDQPGPANVIDAGFTFDATSFDAFVFPDVAIDVRKKDHDAGKDVTEPEDAATADDTSEADEATSDTDAEPSGDGATDCSATAQNGTETDVGCGGSACPACAVGKHCLTNHDCDQSVCDLPDGGGPVGVCTLPSCHDGMKDGQETDVDCGGPSCLACAPESACVAASDCTSQVCTSKVCQAPSCSDTVKNGAETDVDCGGGACPACIVGKQCSVTTDCTSNICTTGTCSCPPNMVIVPANLPGGGDYCVDALEVTYGEYNAFWNSNPGLMNQPSICSWNTTFTPANGWPPDLVTTDPGFNGGDPVNWVNWCQAYGYCVQQGKHLCGKIGGGSNATADATNALKSQWYNACSADGVNVYPYGSAYQAGRCNDSSLALGAPRSELNAEAELVNDACQGGASGLYQMSGDVAEWEDSCSGTAGATDTCFLRGGSYLSGAQTLTCATAVPTPRNYQGGDSGFRCCL